jgi:DNA-binding PadR family transcriptional regulator
MSRRAEVLELAVLGLLHEAPMHGYELRKRLNGMLGWNRAFSYGTLYPCLKGLVTRALIVEAADPAGPAKRPRIVYELTADGKDHFAALIADAGPSAWEDEQFGVHLAFFGRTDAATRMAILQGRRSRLQERLEQFRTSLQRSRERVDSYTLQLQQHGLESVEREVRWLDELIDHERTAAPMTAPATTSTTAPTTGPQHAAGDAGANGTDAGIPGSTH